MEDSNVTEIPRTLRADPKPLGATRMLREALWATDVVTTTPAQSEWRQEEYEQVVPTWEKSNRGLEPSINIDKHFLKRISPIDGSFYLETSGPVAGCGTRCLRRAQGGTVRMGGPGGGGGGGPPRPFA